MDIMITWYMGEIYMPRPNSREKSNKNIIIRVDIRITEVDEVGAYNYLGLN